MTKKNNGESAFPCPETENYKPQWGMSLRDYFAAKALESHPYNAHEFEKIASYVYRMSDAMLAEREK